ncbi:MAG: hypothetical protein AAGD32_17815 [Planctomycetota bacterium]
MNTASLTAVIASVATAGAASADFVSPDSFGWSRGTDNSFYAEWDFFESPTGGNLPDVGQFPSTLPSGWTTPDVVETSGTSFVTSGGNIYSFSAATEFEVTIPSYGPQNGLRDRSSGTTVLVQARTLGNEMDYESMRIGGFDPVEIVELNRDAVGGTFGGTLVDTLFRFEIPDSRNEYLIEFEAIASSMSLDRLSIDTLTFDTLRIAQSDAVRVFGPVPSPGTATAAAALLAMGGVRRRR